jgi:hypothetical protein
LSLGDSWFVFCVIPANPGAQSGVARPGIQEFQRLLDSRFRGNDERHI